MEQLEIIKLTGRINLAIKESKEYKDIFDFIDLSLNSKYMEDYPEITSINLIKARFTLAFKDFCNHITNDGKTFSTDYKTGALYDLAQLEAAILGLKYKLRDINLYLSQFGFDVKTVMAVHAENTEKDELKKKEKEESKNKAEKYGFNPMGSEKQKSWAMDIISEHLIDELFIEMCDNAVDGNDPLFMDYLLHLQRMTARWWIGKAAMMDMKEYQLDWCNNWKRKTK